MMASVDVSQYRTSESESQGLSVEERKGAGRDDFAPSLFESVRAPEFPPPNSD